MSSMKVTNDPRIIQPYLFFMPLDKTFWSPRFGMVEDRFGIGWMIGVIPPGQG